MDIKGISTFYIQGVFNLKSAISLLPGYFRYPLGDTPTILPLNVRGASEWTAKLINWTTTK